MDESIILPVKARALLLLIQSSYSSRQLQLLSKNHGMPEQGLSESAVTASPPRHGVPVQELVERAGPQAALLSLCRCRSTTACHHICLDREPSQDACRKSPPRRGGWPSGARARCAPLATNRRSKRMPEAPPPPPPGPPREGDHPVNRRSTTPSSPRDSLPLHRASHERADPLSLPSSGRRTSTTAASRSPPPPPARRLPCRRSSSAEALTPPSSSSSSGNILPCLRRVPPLRAGIFFLVSADSAAGDAAVVDLLWIHHLPPPWSSASGSWDLSHSITL